jgi:hypothetical protein
VKSEMIMSKCKILIGINVILLFSLMVCMFFLTEKYLINKIVNTGSQEDMKKRNEKIINAINNNESWASDPLKIVSEYFIKGSSLYSIEGREITEIKITPLFNMKGQKYPIVKITVREKHKGDVEQKRSNWNECTLYLESKEYGVWQFIEEPYK